MQAPASIDLSQQIDWRAKTLWNMKSPWEMWIGTLRYSHPRKGISDWGKDQQNMQNNKKEDIAESAEKFHLFYCLFFP